MCTIRGELYGSIEVEMSYRNRSKHFPNILTSTLNFYMLNVPPPKQESFKYYIRQDFYYLHHFAEAYGLAANKAALIKTENAAWREELERELHKLVEGCYIEIKVQKEEAAKMGIALDDYHAIQPAEACRKYTTFLLDVARDPNTTCLEVLVAMLPCMQLYAYLGRVLLRVGEANSTLDTGLGARYARWVRSYGTQGFQVRARSPPIPPHPGHSITIISHARPTYTLTSNMHVRIYTCICTGLV